MMPDFSCALCRKHLADYIIGRVPQDLRRTIERHLDGCADCRQELAEWRAIEAAVRRAPAPEPSQAFAEVWRTLQSELAPARSATITTERALYMDADHPPSTSQAPRESASPSVPPQRPRVSALTRHTRPLAVIAATLIIVMVGAALFAWLRIGRQGPVNANTPTPSGPCAPRQITAGLPAGAEIYDLAMPSPDEGWAVGAIASDSPDQPLHVLCSVLLHYRHGRWQQEGPTFPNMLLFSLTMLSTTEG